MMSEGPAFKPTRSQGLAALADFVPRAGGAYARGRNSDPGPDGRHAVSRLSPYLRHRLLHEREVVSAVLSAHSLEACEKFVQEVFWRSYFKGFLEHHPALWSTYCKERDAAYGEAAASAGLRTGLTEAIHGRTGIECFDAWAAELRATGYLHNHARMWFASIWIFTLQLPWQLGADFFMRHLIDGDPASNTLSWRWVAGLHTKGKHYLARAENITRFTEGRFNPVGQLNENADALVEAEAPRRAPLDFAHPKPAQDDGSRCFLLTDEDLCDGLSALEERFRSSKMARMPERVAVVDLSAGRTSDCASGALDVAQEGAAVACRSPRDQFVQGARLDASDRIKAALGAETKMFSATDTDAVCAWLAEGATTEILMPYPTQGPAFSFAQTLSPQLGAHGLTLTYWLSEYDRLAWPHADRGFFRLKTRIAELVRVQGLQAEPSTLL